MLFFEREDGGLSIVRAVCSETGIQRRAIEIRPNPRSRASVSEPVGQARSPVSVRCFERGRARRLAASARFAVAADAVFFGRDWVAKERVRTIL